MIANATDEQIIFNVFLEMYIFFSVLFGGFAFIVWMLESDKKEARKVNTVIKESKNASSMFMLKSTEQKVTKLKAALNNGTSKNKNKKISMTNLNGIDKNIKQVKIQELLVLSSKYNSGQISLEDYNSKLDELLVQINRNGSLGLVG